MPHVGDAFWEEYVKDSFLGSGMRHVFIDGRKLESTKISWLFIIIFLCHFFFETYGQLFDHNHDLRRYCAL